MANNTENVAVGKPRVNGGIYTAPIGTTLPTDATTTPAEAYKAMGYVSEDGVTNANSISTEVIRAWGGDVVAAPVTERPDEWTFTLIEVLNSDVLKAVYGPDAVTGTLAAGLAVKVSPGELDPMVWVIDMIKNDVLSRVVIPNGKITELGDVVYKDDEVIGFEVTVTAMSDEDGYTHYEYMGGTNGG